MASVLRCLTIIVAVVLLALWLTPTSHAADQQRSAAGLTLLNAANRDRASVGLAPLQWDPALAAAAHQHALRMAQMNTISHQFSGEPPMQDRARQAGARFSVIAENVAEGPSIPGLHTQWMNSPPHRANLLNPELNSIGIAVVQSGNMFFAVQDFSVAVPALTLETQEQLVASQLASHGLRAVSLTADARKTCAGDHDWTGETPMTVIRYESGDLSHLPAEIEPKITSGRFRSFAVGACNSSGSGDFTRFRIAILLY